MAGSISLSMSQQFDENGSPLSGGLLYMIQAGTTSTPQNAYQDSALTIAHPNPITLDSAGRIPQLYLADGSIKIRLTDSAGVQQLVADNILVVGPSSGSGGGGSVDATTVLSTGDLKAKYSTGTLSGFVRCNGRTIGSATSGASERANADTQALFEFLWGVDATLSVSGGRGATANADWVANKTLALPDFRGRALAALDDMGGGPKSILTTSYFGSDPTVLGAVGGGQATTVLRANLPNVSLTFTGTFATVTSTSTAGNVLTGTVSNNAFGAGSGGSVITTLAPSSVGSSTITSQGNITPAGTISSLNGGVTQTAVGILQPTILTTIYIKL